MNHVDENRARVLVSGAQHEPERSTARLGDLAVFLVLVQAH